MAYRPLEVTLISAKDLSNVNLFTKMEVYAVAMLAGDTKSRKKTAVDRDGGKNPVWNATVKFNVMESGADRAVLHIVLRSERALGDREIGEVHVPIRELLDGWYRGAAAGGSSSGGAADKKAGPPAQFVSYQVRNNSGKAKGVLNISYKFGDLSAVAAPPQYTANPAAAYAAPVVAAYPPPPGPAYPPPAAKLTAEPATAYPPQDTKTPNTKGGSEPVTAYPVGAAGASTAYPPPGAYPYQPQQGYGYPPPPQAGYAAYPPPAGYGYPPQQGGYGYPPQQGGYGYGAPPLVQPQQPKKNKFGGAGAGLGLGLLGGALGGMLIGDMVSDAAYDGAYDGGYDGGFDDGGFGF